VNFKDKCLIVIQTLVSGDFIKTDPIKLNDRIYRAAHVGLGDCDVDHQIWIDEVNQDYEAFKKLNMI